MSKTKTLAICGQRSRTSMILVELLLVLDEQEARTAVVQDIFDLLGGVGRIDAVGDAADAHDAHVGVEPFRHCLGQDRNHLAALQPEPDQAEPGPLRAIAVVAPGRGAPDAKPLLAEGCPRAPRGDLVPKQLGDRVAAVDLDARTALVSTSACMVGCLPRQPFIAIFGSSRR